MSVYPYLSILTGYTHVLPTNYPGCLAGCHLAWSPRNKGTCPANQQKTTRRQTRWPRRQSPRRSCSCRRQMSVGSRLTSQAACAELIRPSAVMPGAYAHPPMVDGEAMGESLTRALLKPDASGPRHAILGEFLGRMTAT
jgi:hypothetical protein